MKLLLWLFLQIFYYGVFTWVILVAIAFCSARYTGRFGKFAGPVSVAIIIGVLDFRLVTAAMNAPGWDPSADDALEFDMVFFMGYFIRVLLISLVLLPVTVWGRRLRNRSRTNPSEPNVA